MGRLITRPVGHIPHKITRNSATGSSARRGACELGRRKLSSPHHAEAWARRADDRTIARDRMPDGAGGSSWSSTAPRSRMSN